MNNTAGWGWFPFGLPSAIRFHFGLPGEIKINQQRLPICGESTYRLEHGSGSRAPSGIWDPQPNVCGTYLAGPPHPGFCFRELVGLLTYIGVAWVTVATAKWFCSCLKDPFRKGGTSSFSYCLSEKSDQAAAWKEREAEHEFGGGNKLVTALLFFRGNREEIQRGQSPLGRVLLEHKCMPQRDLSRGRERNCQEQ